MGVGVRLGGALGMAQPPWLLQALSQHQTWAADTLGHPWVSHQALEGLLRGQFPVR